MIRSNEMLEQQHYKFSAFSIQIKPAKNSRKPILQKLRGLFLPFFYLKFVFDRITKTNKITEQKFIVQCTTAI